MTTTSIDLDAALDDVLEHEYDQTSDTAAEVEASEPYIAAIAVSALFADPTYQRELDTFRVDKMANAYRIALVGIIEVSARPGDRYAILDGQHRAAAVKTAAFGSPNEDPHIPCRIHTGLTIAAEAKLYHELNTTRKQLTGWDRWVARRGAGDQVVRDIETVLEGNGLTVAIREGADYFRATRSAEKIVELGGLGLLDDVVKLSRGTWPGDQTGLDGDLLHGLAHVRLAYAEDEIDATRLVTALAAIMPRQLSARASAARELHKGTKDRLIGHVVVELYNGTKGPRLEPFLSRVKPVSKTKNTIAERTRKAKNDRIRAWAVDQGLMKSTSTGGQIRKNVREAYEQAHGTAEGPA